MRLIHSCGLHNIEIIEDNSPSNMVNLKQSLSFLNQQPHEKKAIILYDIPDTELNDHQLTEQLIDWISPMHLSRFIGIGSFFLRQRTPLLSAATHVACYSSIDSFLAEEKLPLHEELILLKGNPFVSFKKVIHQLQQHGHSSVMEIDVNKIIQNIKYLKSKAGPNVKTLIILKASSYGSDIEERMSWFIQSKYIDYLGVAYVDEGIKLRKKKVQLPILILNVSECHMEAIIQYQLEPVIYSIHLLREVGRRAKGRKVRIHIEWETGLNRFGFFSSDIDEMIHLLKSYPFLEVVSMFSHLVGSNDPTLDALTHRQANLFEQSYTKLCQALGIRPLRHLLNSAGVLRFPQYRYDMIRAGIGIYGIDPTPQTSWEGLNPAFTVKSVVSQVKKVRVGERISYGGTKLVDGDDMMVATIAMGYADGFIRSFSNGVGKVLIRGHRAPVVGVVCMDMTMVDVTSIPGVREGDEVIMFGDGLPLWEVAHSVNTIPHEILTGIGPRVKRVFFYEPC